MFKEREHGGLYIHTTAEAVLCNLRARTPFSFTLYISQTGSLLQALVDQPELVNSAAEGDGWMVKLSDASAPANMMDAAAYAKFCEEEAH